jgi:hypothetical protein
MVQDMKLLTITHNIYKYLNMCYHDNIFQVGLTVKSYAFNLLIFLFIFSLSQ